MTGLMQSNAESETTRDPMRCDCLNDIPNPRTRGRALMMPERSVYVAAVGLAVLIGSSATAQDAIYVRDHRGLQVLVQPIGRSADLVVVREIYREKGERRGSTNGIYAYDCSKGVLRYVDPDDDRVIKDTEFYEGVYGKAHQQLCSRYKGPQD